ncbi:MAG: DUF1003 domain-containing protein [Chthoniobacterales bacterium]
MGEQGKEQAGEEWPLAAVVERNIRALIARRQQEEQRKPAQQRMADAVTRFTGSIRFVYIHLILFGSWIALNLPWLPTPKFDPTFVVLAMFASVEAIFLSTFVLITQNRMAEQADKRAELDLQVSLLAEHEVTRLLNLVTAIADKLEIDVHTDPELEELRKDVPPERVLDAMEHSTWAP